MENRTITDEHEGEIERVDTIAGAYPRKRSWLKNDRSNRYRSHKHL